MAKTAILTLKILADAKDATTGLDKTAKGVDKFQSGVGKAALPAAAALAALGAGAMSAAQAAAEDEQSAALLAKALKNTTGATQKQIDANEQWISKTSKAAAVADDELRPAMSTLVRATGDVTTAQDAMGLALDISAATGKDLDSVSAALAKGYAGNTTALGKMVPGLDKATLASKDMTAITEDLAGMVGGSAADAANTTAGRMENMKIQMAEAEEAIGSLLLPVLGKLADVLQTAATWVQNNTRVIAIIGGVVGGFAAAILILNGALRAYQAVTKAIQVATKIWTAAQWLLNAAMSANPIGLIIVAIVAVIAIIVLLWIKCAWFRDAVLAVWEAIRVAAAAVWEWIVNAVKLAVAFLVVIVKAYVSVVLAVWRAIATAAGAAWAWIVGAVTGAINRVKAIIQAIKTVATAVWGAIKNAAVTAFETLRSTVKTVMDKVLAPIHAVEDAFGAVGDAIQTVIGWIKKIKIPNLGALGKLLPGGKSAPAPGGTFVAPTVGRAAPTLGASSTRGGGAPVVINVTGALDPVGVARQIRAILRDDSRRRGGVVIA
jgi:phage-related protein